MSDDNPWASSPSAVSGKEFNDWTTTEALDVARKFAEQLKTDPELQGPLSAVLFGMIDWALDLIEPYNKLTGDKVTMGEVGQTFACMGLATPDFLSELLRNLALFKRKDYSAMDPCMIAMLARLGGCYLRNTMNQTLGPDLLDFWLYGKGNDPANLTVEDIQLIDAEGRPFGQALSYKPIESAEVMKRIGKLIRQSVSDTYEPLLSQICERLHAPPNTLFPQRTEPDDPESRKVLHKTIEIAPGRNALQEDGFQVLYTEQKFGQDSTLDPELYILVISALLSEVRVRAIRGTWTDAASGAIESGWEVTLDSWKVRFWDWFDFHTGLPFYVPLGGGVPLNVPDELFTRIESGWDCSRFGTPPVVPGNYLLMSDSWIDMDVKEAGEPRVFIPDGSTCDGTYHPLPPAGGGTGV